MRALGIIAAFIALLIGGPIVWWKINYPTYSYRYRMTVEVEENGTIHSGSSVIEIKIDNQPRVGGAPLYVTHVRGEAVFVDLGDGRNVIALLANALPVQNINYPESIVPVVFGLPFKDWAKLPHLNGKREIPASRMPNFVTFSNLRDAKTARMVRFDGFSKVFGPDVKPPRVTIEMTKDPVTREIFQKLPWLARLKGYSGGQFQPDWSRPERNLTAGLFARGAL